MSQFYRFCTYSAKNIFLTLFLFSTISISAQNDFPELTKEKQKFIIDEISQLLIDHYVFPEIAEKTASHLNNQLENGVFDNYLDVENFSKEITKKLQSITNDKHMKTSLKKKRQLQEESENPLVSNYKETKTYLEKNYGFLSVQILENNVGYIDLRSFSNFTYSKPTLVATMKFLENCDAIIFDLRKNGGGHPQTVQYLCSYFFEEKTHLNSLYWREGNITKDFYTIDEIDGKRSADRPLFIITSNYTFSGAEEFSYNMLTQNRATLVGEITGGGANPGRTFPVTPYMRIFIPTGKAINPITKTNWEGVGVEPNIKCSAENAYQVTIDEAGKAAQIYKEEKLNKMISIAEHLNKQLEIAENLVIDQKINNANTTITKALELGFSNELLDEDGINILGYKYLMNENNVIAISIFDFNTKKHPNSFNVYDSLGEAYMKNNQSKLAITNYKKSYSLNNQNKNALDMIQKMGGTL